MSIIKRTKLKKLPKLRLVQLPAVLLGSFGLTGYFPVASGTVASLAACAVYVVLPPGLPWLVPALGALLFLLGVPACGWLAERYEHPDPSQATIDEGAVMLLVLSYLPRTWFNLALAFLLFRFFDIAKVWPARPAEKLPGGWGIMIDDLVAGAYSVLILWVVNLSGFLPAWALTPLPLIWS
jgi:phosphatidylglycerophosphatase A